MNRRSHGWRRRWQRFWEACAWYAGAPGRALNQVGQSAARGWRRRFRKPGQAIMGLVTAPFLLLGRLLRQTGWLLSGWWRNRNFRALLEGLPALLLGSGAIFLGVFLWLTPPTLAIDSYLQEARRQLLAKDYDAAMICYQRLALLNEDKPEYRYKLAAATLLKAQADQSTAFQDRALAQLDKLAAPDKQGYVPAHLWQARRHLAAGQLVDAEKHLVRALQGDPESLEANILLGQIYLATKRLNQAEPLLLKGVQARPELRFALAQLYSTRGNKEESRRQVEQALQHFRAQSQADVDNHAARLYWAEAAMMLGDFPQSVKLLQEGLALTPQPGYRHVLSKVYLAWSDVVAGDPEKKAGNRLALLEKSMEYDFDNPGLAQRLLELTKSKEGEAEKARALLQSLLAQGKSPATVHVLLGMDAWAQGKGDEARQHLEQAYKLSPHGGVVANNLAWALANTEPVDLNRALELSDSVVKRYPGVLRFRDTRGHILVKLGRWQDALADLEASLPALEDKRESHRALAKVYQELGNKAMAEEHKRLAEAKPAADSSRK